MSTARLREAGDSALILEVGATRASPLRPQDPIDADVNERAIAIAAALRRRAIPGVRDVIPTFRSVAVFLDPLSTEVEAVAAALHEASDVAGEPERSGGARHAPARAAAATLEVPVAYGGEFGPDLADVAAFAGCSPQEVIDRHAVQTYRVFMLGFLPGFAYLASVDETIAAPRRATPRLRVPAGSVGIAGRQTAVYPRESPGGWQIIGRTPLSVFDPSRTPPSAFAPGDHVRFVPSRHAVSGLGRTTGHVGSTTDTKGAGPTRCLTVLSPGLLTTVQDSGRWGYQHLGVPVSGPMDPVAHRLANAIVGNHREAAALEVTLVGPELQVGHDTSFTIAGADLQARLNGAAVPLQTRVSCRAGSVLRFGMRRFGARASVAFDGGIVVPPVLGSRSTHLLSGLGGIDGRAVKAGDRISLGELVSAGERGVTGGASARDPDLSVQGGVRLRILPGPQLDQFHDRALDLLQRIRYRVSTESDRMGYRLIGGAPLPRAGTPEMISDVTFPGGLQVPPSGDPILLMADRQTTGGYPQIAILISADLQLAAQLAPGDWVEFQLCSRTEALVALVAQERRLLAVG